MNGSINREEPSKYQSHSLNWKNTDLVVVTGQQGVNLYIIISLSDLSNSQNIFLY